MAPSDIRTVSNDEFYRTIERGFPTPCETEGGLWEPATGWLVCDTCLGSGDAKSGDVILEGMCQDCGGTGEPPMKQVS